MPRSARGDPHNAALASYLESLIPSNGSPHWARNLSKAASNIRKEPIPIRCVEDALRIDNVGDAIAAKIATFLIQHNVQMPQSSSAAAAAAAAALRRQRLRQVAEDGASSSAALDARHGADGMGGGLVGDVGGEEEEENGEISNAAGGRGRGMRRNGGQVHRQVEGGGSVYRQAPSGAIVLQEDDHDIPESSPMNAGRGAGIRGGRGRGRGRGPGRGRGRGRGRSGGRGNSPVQRQTASAAVVVDEEAGGSTGRGETQTTGRSGQRPFKVVYKQAKYAILVAMHQLQLNGSHEVTKDQIVQIAQDHHPYPMVKLKTGNPNTHYDGWSSMSELTRKGFVAWTRAQAPKLFILTDSGKEAAAECWQEMERRERGGDGGCGDNDDGGDGGDGNSSSVAGASQQELLNVAQIYNPQIESVQEFGRPGDSNVQQGRARSTGGGIKRFSEATVKRASRVVERLERDGLRREECLTALGIVFEQGLPKTEDGVYEKVSEQVWRRRREVGEEEHFDNERGEEDVMDLTGADSEEEVMDLTAGRSGGGQHVEKDSSSVAGEQVRGVSCLTERGNELVRRISSVDDVQQELRADSSRKRPRGKITLEDDVICLDDDDDEPTPKPSNLVCQNLEPSRHTSTIPLSTPSENSSLDLIQTELDKSARSSPTTVQTSRAPQSSIEPHLSTTQPVAIPQTSASQPATACHELLFILDSRERIRGEKHDQVATMQHRLQRDGVLCEQRQLPCGDALFVSKSDNGTEMVLDYIIERKRVDDFASSIKDGRVAMQSYLMREGGLNRRIFVLEGEVRGDEYVDEGNVRRELARLEICEGFYIKRTRDLMDTLLFYRCMWQSLKQEKGNVLYKDWSEGIERIRGGVTLERMLFCMLRQIKGVGDGTARQILATWKTPQALFKALTQGGLEGVPTRARRAIADVFLKETYPTEMVREGGEE